MGRKAALSCMSRTLGCGIDPVVLCDDAVVHAVVEFGATVYGNSRSAGGMNGRDEFDGGLLHLPDSSKVRLQRRASAGDSTKVAAKTGVFAHQEGGFPLQILFGQGYIPA
jgi:hypothetical protein